MAGFHYSAYFSRRESILLEFPCKCTDIFIYNYFSAPSFIFFMSEKKESNQFSYSIHLFNNVINTA